MIKRFIFILTALLVCSVFLGTYFFGIALPVSALTYVECCDDSGCCAAPVSDPNNYDCCDRVVYGLIVSCPCEGCFTGETGIQLKTEDSKLETKEIKDLTPGDVVESFNPETGEITEGTVSDVTKTTREGYYILETEGGEKVKVTGEHPFLAIKGENNQAPNSPAGRDPATRDKSQTISKFQNSILKLEDILSQTLTYKLITGLQAKVNEALH